MDNSSSIDKLNFYKREDLEKYVKKHYVKALGLGQEGSCYLLDSGVVIKVFNYGLDPVFALKLKDYKNDSFAFPKSGIIINNSIHAIIMDYIEGKTLKENIPNDQNLLVLGDHLQVLTNNIRLLSSEGVKIKDFFKGNIIYDYKKFTIIDTNSYLLIPKTDFFEENMYEVMNKLFNYLFSEFSFEKDFEKLKKSRLELLSNPKKYLEYVKYKVENKSKKEVITLSDAKKLILKK